MRAARATTVAFVVGAVLASFAQPAFADDPITAALKRKEELERAVQISRANAERYQAVANQFQAVVNQTNARISDLAEKQANAQSEADQLFYQIQIAEEQPALVTFQLDETKALTDSLKLMTMSAPRTAFWWGLLYGGVFFLILLRWLNFTFRVYSTIPGPLVFLPTVLLAGYCAFWIGAVAWAVSRVATRWSVGWALAVTPFFWVAGEWLRGHLFGGFPWGTIAYSQYLNLRMIQIAELTGVHGVSLLILAVNTALAGCLLLTWRHALAGVADVERTKQIWQSTLAVEGRGRQACWW